MNKNEVLDIFNKQFKELVEDISRVFPGNSDISTFKMALPHIIFLSTKKIFKVYKKYVVEPYREQILAGDINFFIDKDYKMDLNLGESSNISTLEKIDCLRGPIREMNQDEQAKVIKYMQNMSKLCDLYDQL
jgi:hypothetical protein